MLRFHLIALAALALLVPAAWAGAPVICNDDMGPLWLTYITQDGGAYHAHGWYRMEAGVCAVAAVGDGQTVWLYGQNATGDEAFTGTHGFCITNDKMDNAEVKFLGTGTMINYVPPGVGLKPCSDPRRVGVFAEIAPKEDRMAISARCPACGGAMPARPASAVSGAKPLGEGVLQPSGRGAK